MLNRETAEEDILELVKQKPVLEQLVIHGVDGDQQDSDGKNKFNKQELEAIYDLEVRTKALQRNWSDSR